MYLCNVCVPHACRCLRRPEEGVRSPRTGHTGSHKPLWVLGSEPWSKARAGVTELSLQPQGMSFVSLWGLEGCYRAAAKQVCFSTSPSFRPCSLPAPASLLSTPYFLCVITYTPSFPASSESYPYKHTHCLLFVAPDLSTAS